MHRILFVAVATFAALVAPTGATAMGFARTATQSTLGMPLNFVATISLEQDESLSRDCVSAQVMAGEFRVPPPNVYVSIGAVREAASRDVRVTTTTPIDEPVVSIELSVGCNSKMVRRFVAFIDPPSVQLAQANPVDGGDVDAPPVASQAAALADTARRSDAARRAASGVETGGGDASRNRHAAARERGQRLAGGGSQSTVVRHTRIASGQRRGAQVAAASGRSGSRLQLDAPRLLVPSAAPAGTLPAAAVVAAATSANAASGAAASTIAALATPPAPATSPVTSPIAIDASASGAAGSEHDRMAMLEAGLASLRDDSLATHRTIGVLQAKLRDAESARYANGLVYALAAASLFLGLVVAALLWIRPRQRRRARWFDAAAERHARTTRSAEREAAAETMPTVTSTATARAALVKTRVDTLIDFPPEPSSFAPATLPASIGGLEVTTVLGPQLARAMLPKPASSSGEDAARKSGDLSMEELIDLEQQAEFFVVLGQDEAAMSLLDAYMRSDGGKSPLPYLQLLEIHQRRADAPAYENVRRAFNVRFKANAPEWSTDLHFGRSLLDYPQTVARLQALWTTPLSAMQALDALLFRRQPADDTFDFPAYRELLFLYSIARELSGQVETDFGSIDLFLPLEDAVLVAPMSPSNTMRGALELAIDLDVSS